MKTVSYLTKNSVQCVVSTNGWSLDRARIVKLKESGIGAVYISFDGHEAEIHDYVRNRAGSFERAVNATKLCKEFNVPFRFSTVVTSINYKYIRNIVNLAESLGADEINLKRFRVAGNGKENYEEFILSKAQEKEMTENVINANNAASIRMSFVYHDFPIPGLSQKCPCGKSSIGMMANGDLKLCVYGDEISGNILRDDLQEIWTKDKRFVLIRREDESGCVAPNKIDDAIFYSAS